MRLLAKRWPGIHSAVLALIIFFTGCSLAQLAVASNDGMSDGKWVKAIANDDTSTLTEILSDTKTPDVLVSLRAETGKTALMIACKLGDRALIDQLLELGADVNAVTKTGGTPFMFASLGGHRALVKYLATLGVDKNAQGANGWSATTIAAAKGYTELLIDLIELGTDINARDVYQWTPLMRAVDNGHTSAAAVLLQQPTIELDLQDEAGNTALHHAAANGDVKNIRQLVAKGANKKIKNSHGFEPIQLAAASPNAASSSEALLSR